jgi:hypothetical protein
MSVGSRFRRRQPVGGLPAVAIRHRGVAAKWRTAARRLAQGDRTHGRLRCYDQPRNRRARGLTAERCEIIELMEKAQACRDARCPSLLLSWLSETQGRGDRGWTARRACGSAHLGERLLAKFVDHRARSLAYRMGVVLFPVMKNLTEFGFSVSPINQGWCVSVSTAAYAPLHCLSGDPEERSYRFESAVVVDGPHMSNSVS